MYKLKHFLLLPVLLIFVMFLCSCTTSYIKYKGEDYYITTTSQNQLNQDELTLDSKNFLTTNDLNEQYKSSPREVIYTCFQELNKNESKIILEHNFRHTLKVIIELCINEAKNAHKDEAIKYWMSACYLSYRYLYDTAIQPPLSKLKFPWTGTVERYYNFALYKIFTYLQNQNLLNESNFEIDMVIGTAKFNPPESNIPWKLSSFKKFLLSYNYKPENFNETIFQLGVGLPICGIPDDLLFDQILEKVKVIKYLYPCNFVLLFNNLTASNNKFTVTPCYIDFYKSAYTELKKNKIQLSNNYTVTIGKFLEKYPMAVEATYFFDPGEIIDYNTEGIYMLTPFDKNKIPVLFIHGLISDPQSFSQIINTLMQSNTIRDNYQFWFYFYPTGQSVLLDSFTLRNTLNRINKKYANGSNTKFNEMVVVGYSLGGLVAQLLIQDSKGNYLEKEVFYTELQKLDIEKEHKKLLIDMLNFKPLPYIKRTIFISTPHKGAEMAAWVSSQLMGDLVISPSSYYQEYKKTIMYISTFTREYNDRVIYGNSVDNLNPKSPFTKLVSSLPYSKKVKINSIIGDENEAGNIGGSDGIVPYASSHLNNSETETIIKSDHHSIYKPACAKEIYRLLLNNINYKEL